MRRACLRLALVLTLALAPAGALAPAAHAQYGATFGRNKIQYEGFDWHILQTPHFDVYYYPEARALAEIGAHMAEEQYAELENRFSHSLNGRTPLIFYASNLHFKQTNITPGFIPDGVGGFFEFLKGRVVLPANGDLHRFKRVIRHELVHVFTYSKVLRGLADHRVPTDRFLPLWFTEGLAEYWSGTPDYQHEMMLRDALFSGYFVPLENIDRIQGTYQMYKQGEAACRFISERYGEEKLLALVDNLWRDRDFRAVMAFTLGEDFRTVSERYGAWIKAQYYPALREAELATLISGGLSTEGYSAKPTVYRRRDGQRTVVFVGNKTGYSNVYAVDVDSAYRPEGRPRVVVAGERSNRFEAFHLFESRMDVSQDGRLAFATKSGEADVLHVYDLERRRMEATYRLDSLVAVYSPAWSPDGERLAFSAIDRSGFADLYTFAPATGTLDRLTRDTYDDRDPAWNPDGATLAFASDRGADGAEGASNLFTLDAASGRVRQLTFGPNQDLAPSWAPDGRRLVFISARRDSTGRFGAQDLWVADLAAEPIALASRAAVAGLDATSEAFGPPPVRLRPLARVTAAASDPVWTDDDAVVFGNLEHYRFTVRALTGVSGRLATAEPLVMRPAPADTARWTLGRLGDDQGEAKTRPYRRRYTLDVAQGGVSQSPLIGTTGGAQLMFSDMMGDDLWFVSLYNTGQGSSDFLRSLNVNVTRVDQGRRATVAYGGFRYGGLRYDLTDSEANETLPIVYETLYGGFGAVAYPVSMFRRVEASTSLARSMRSLNGERRDGVLLANTVGFTHDNALYGYNGPIDGLRAGLTVGYTTDVWQSNESYFTLNADARRYWRLGRDVTFAQWAQFRGNEGRRARLNLIGGAWDLRGFGLLSVRAQKLWHTSHELRFPLLYAPSAYVPLLAPLGIANLRGALFFDAAHAWSDGYRTKFAEGNARAYNGETLGALGGGLRMNLFGAIVLRYDVGYRYRDGFRHRDKFFRQFFFGYDF